MIRSCSDCYALTLVKGRGYVSLCMAQWNLLLLLCGYLLIHMYILQSVFCIAFDALCSEVKGLYIVLRWKVYISHVLIYRTPCTGLCLPTATFASSLTSPPFYQSYISNKTELDWNPWTWWNIVFSFVSKSSKNLGQSIKCMWIRVSRMCSSSTYLAHIRR